VTGGVAAVFQGPGRPSELVEYPLRAPAPGEVLVRVLLSTVCGSDVHAWTGRRALPTPTILGHEIVGVIEALGSDAPRDLRDRSLAPGQRVTWTEYIACGRCVACAQLALPQKCARGRKYGHESVVEPPHLLGGFGQFCYLLPGTGIALIPEELTDEEAAPVNCGVATMVAVTEAAAIDPDDTVVVFGAGLLGLYGVAMARAKGAAHVIAIDAVTARRTLACRFGADEALDPERLGSPELAACVLDRCRRGGSDVVIETAGAAAALDDGLRLLRPGGRFVTAGLVLPGSIVTLDASEIVRRCVTIRGVHNYAPCHLIAALDFVREQRTRLPLGELVDTRFPLEATDAALIAAAERRALRPAVVPH
jgi:putative phosphonate catabolism associated alcohol dehydrogenase